MKYSAKHVLNGSIDEVLEIIMDRSRDPRVYPNVTSVKQTKYHATCDEIFCEFLVRGDGEIPKALQLLVSPKLLTWLEIGHWDKAQNLYTYELRPNFFTKFVRARGSTRFTAISVNSVLREFEAEMWIDIPLLGELASKTIAKFQLDNYVHEEKMFDIYLKEHRKKGHSARRRISHDGI